MSQMRAPETHAEAGPVFDVVHADILRRFPQLVAQLGGDAKALLADVGIDLDDLRPEAPSAGYRVIATLLEHAAASLKCPDFGMRLADLQGARVFGAMGAVMQNSNTLGEAIEYASKHAAAHSLAARIRLDRDHATQTVFVGHEILLDRLPNKCQAIEQVLLLGHLNIVETTGGRARVRKVLFRHQPIAPLSAYRRYFGCEVQFDQREDGVVLFERDLLCAIVDRDARIHARAASFIEAKYSGVSPPMQAQVRGVILQFIGAEGCTNEKIAAELGLHPRTLHRRLKEEGKSFQDIKDEVRRDVALYYLHQTDLDLTHIAEKLGYAEHSVLTRSCVRWFAAPPSELRLGRRGRENAPPSPREHQPG